MRSMFPGYSKKSDEEVAAIWQTATFVFDTNVLLHAYRYKPELQAQLLDYWQRLRDRVWLPHQVALEYHRNVPNAIMGEQLAAYQALREAVSGAREVLAAKLQRLHDQYNTRYLSLEPAPIIEKLSPGFDAALQLIDNTRESVPKDQSVADTRERIDTIFADRVGNPHPLERQTQVYQDAEHRYLYQIPPGFADAPVKEGSNRFGDVVLWLQILEFAKEKQTPIIFVTDDAKGDWWEDGKPHRALAQELYEYTGMQLLQLRSEQFLSGVKQHLNIAVKQEVIDEAREFGEESKAQEREYRNAPSTSAWELSRNLGNIVGVQDSLTSLTEIHGVTGKQGSYMSQLLSVKSAVEKFVEEGRATISSDIAAQTSGIVEAAAQTQAMLRAIDQSSAMIAGRGVQQINEMQLGHAQRFAQDLTKAIGIVNAQAFTLGMTSASAAALALTRIPGSGMTRDSSEEALIDPSDEEVDSADNGLNGPA